MTGVVSFLVIGIKVASNVSNNFTGSVNNDGFAIKLICSEQVHGLILAHLPKMNFN